MQRRLVVGADRQERSDTLTGPAHGGPKAALSGLAQPDAEEYRKIQNEHDDYLYSSLRSRIKRGEPAAVHAAIAGLNHQAKLNGIAMKKVELTGKDGKPLIPALAWRDAVLDELEKGE